MTITIAARFNGPPGSAQGGITCGLAAALVDADVVQVTLREPPPLDATMTVARAGDHVRLEREGEVIVEAEPSVLDLEVPEPVPFERAAEAAASYAGFQAHPFPTCFVCGPAREEGDGLRLFTGAVPERRLGASPWIPDPSLDAGDGCVGAEIMWGALDCPSLWGAMAVEPLDEVCVLGRLVARVDRRVRVGERCVVIGWPLGRDGRKTYAGSAVYDEDGRVAAAGRATWITLA